MVALFALPLLSGVVGAPAARLSAHQVALPHVTFTTMVKLTVVGATLGTQHHPARSPQHSASQGAGPQGALSAALPGSLPRSAAAPRAAQPPPPPGYPSCFDTVQVRLRVAGYTQKVLGTTTPGGELALLKQVTAGCKAGTRSDQVAVQSLFNAKKTSVQSSDFMFWGWLTPGVPGAQILKNVGYGPTPIAQSMKSTYAMTAAQTAQVLKDLGYAATPNMQALKDVYALNAQSSSQILKNVTPAGFYTASQNGLALKNVFGSTAPQMSQILFNDGYTAPQNGQALVDVFPAVTAVVATGYLKTDGYNAKDVGTTLKDVYHVSASDMAQIFKTNGYSANENATNLKDLYALTPGQAAIALAAAPYTITPIAGALKDVFGQTPAQAVVALKGAGFPRDAVASAVTTTYSLPTATTLAQALFGSYDACNVGLGTKYMFVSAGSAAIAAALKAVFPAVNDVAAGLKCAYGTYTAFDIAPLLKGVGFGAVDTSNGLKSAYPGLVDSQMAQALKASFPVADVAANVERVYSIGTLDALAKALKGGTLNTYDANQIGTAIKTNHGSSAPDVAHALGASTGAGFPVLATAAVVYGPLFGQDATNATKSLIGAGYVPQDLGDALDQAFHQNALVSGNILKGEGFEAPKVADMLKNSSFHIPLDAPGVPGIAKLLTQMTFDPAGVATALKDTYLAPLEAVGGYLKLAGLAFDVIGGVLKDVYHAGEEAITGLMHDIGAGIDDISSTLINKYGVAGEVAAGYLQAVGFTARAVGKVLATAFQLSEGAVEVALTGAHFAADAIEDAIDFLGDLFDDIWPF